MYLREEPLDEVEMYLMKIDNEKLEYEKDKAIDKAFAQSDKEEIDYIIKEGYYGNNKRSDR